MRKILLAFFAIFLILISNSFISAALCKDSSGYYNDCGDNSNQRTPMFMGNNNPYLVDRAYYSHYYPPYSYSNYYIDYCSSPYSYSRPYYSGPYFYGGPGFYGGYYGSYGYYGGYYSSYYW